MESRAHAFARPVRTLTPDPVDNPTAVVPDGDAGSAHRITAALRQTETVTALELFFDVVFVLAITQCTAYMASHPSWTGLIQGVIVLAVLWWGWVGYAWLTSVVDPEEGWVRLAIFAAMAALLVVSLAIPEAFGDLGLLFAGAYAIFRLGQIALFLIASEDDPELRRSVTGLGISTSLAVIVLIVASFTDGALQIALWALAISGDVASPYIWGSRGWKLEPSHFAERHRLIIIIALGESIVAIGAGASHGIGVGEVVAAILGTGIAVAIWWLYFDVVAVLTERRLINAPAGLIRNEMARDVYSYLHFPMVAGIVLCAFGLKTTLAHPGEGLDIEAATALYGGIALYLLGHIAIRLRNVGSVNRERLGLAILLVATIPLITGIAASVAVALALAALSAVIVYETQRYGESRQRVRHDGYDPRAG